VAAQTEAAAANRRKWSVFSFSTGGQDGDEDGCSVRYEDRSVVGNFFSEILVDGDKYLEKGKEIEADVEELKKVLAKWCITLDGFKQGVQPSPSIQALETAIRGFKTEVDQWKPNGLGDKVKDMLRSSRKQDAFTNTYRAFQKELDNLKLVIMLEILQTIVENHKELREQVEGVG